MKPITELFYRYLNNQCTGEELNALLRYFDQQEDNSDLKRLIMDQLKADAPDNFEQQPEVISVFNQTDQYLQHTLFQEQNVRRMWPKRFLRYAVAASLAGILLVSAYLVSQNHNNAGKEVAKKQTEVLQDANPGTDKAVLILADGTSVTLDEHHKQAMLTDAGIKIRKTADGAIIYEAANVLPENGELKYNQLRTPKGAQYEIVLPDGTRVWLNAASSLRYPLVFTGNERRVELTGEGYFEVEKSFKNGRHIPFYVETPTQVVQVLGTEFNISAYEDDQAVKTTLISGKVNVSKRSGKESEILSPGEQSILIEGNDFQVIKTNPEMARAWKNGNFLYEDMYLKDILKQLSRWYDVKVDYSNVPQTRYNMLISRKETLQNVLNMLRKTGNVQFKLENNVIKIIY
jgi:transmembrane sensor